MCAGGAVVSTNGMPTRAPQAIMRLRKVCGSSADVWDQARRCAGRHGRADVAADQEREQLRGTPAGGPAITWGDLDGAFPQPLCPISLCVDADYDRCAICLPWGPEALWGAGGRRGTTGRDGAPLVVVGRRRAHRVVRRALDHGRLVGGLGRIPGEWGDGHRLLPAACASRLLAHSQ